MEQRRQRENNSGQIMHLVLIVLFLFLTISLIIKSCTPSEPDEPKKNSGISLSTNPGSTSTEPEETQPQGPYVTATASIGITGDIMAHGPVIQSALQEDGTYDFSESFRYIAPYYESYDFMIANLELTMGGTAAGEYRGYPTFNCPDSMVDALKGAGIDMVLTANNHSYDTGHAGFIRTQEVLNEKGLLYTGSQLSEDDADYIVQDINGIRVGMISYTYETEGSSTGKKTLNGIAVAEEDTNLINSFNYRQMDKFYSDVESAIGSMESDGADVVIFFIHWGNEYEQSPSNTQKKIAQNLCNLGVDVIVGGHPHVVQPMQVLTSENTGEQTYCIYSTGNAISNQRRYEIKSSPNGHTEDGMIFSLEFQRWSDGTVTISDLNVTPLWVSLDETNGKNVYTILPVDISYQALPTISQFADTVNGVIDPARAPTSVEAFVPTNTSEITASYNRTMNIVQTSLNECRQALGLSPIENASGG